MRSYSLRCTSRFLLANTLRNRKHSTYTVSLMACGRGKGGVRWKGRWGGDGGGMEGEMEGERKGEMEDRLMEGEMEREMERGDRGTKGR